MLSRKRSNFERNRKCESFLSRLHSILSNKIYDNIIRWSNDGNRIIIIDVNKLSEIILPKFYKHHNYSSFVRQLNMYDFHKSKGILDYEEFEHKKFNQNCTIEEINKIFRKNNKLSKDLNQSNENLVSILIEKQEKNEKNQTFLKLEINEIKKINTELKNQIHQKQSEIINQTFYLKKVKYLFVFLMSIIMKQNEKSKPELKELINKFNEEKLTKENTITQSNVINVESFSISKNNISCPNTIENNFQDLSLFDNEYEFFGSNDFDLNLSKKNSSFSINNCFVNY